MANTERRGGAECRTRRFSRRPGRTVGNARRNLLLPRQQRSDKIPAKAYADARLPDERTLLHFPHRLELHLLAERIEHPFRVLKRQFGFAKVRYKGLKKNTAQLVTLFALSNL